MTKSLQLLCCLIFVYAVSASSLVTENSGQLFAQGINPKLKTKTNYSNSPKFTNPDRAKKVPNTMHIPTTSQIKRTGSSQSGQTPGGKAKAKGAALQACLANCPIGGVVGNNPCQRACNLKYGG